MHRESVTRLLIRVPNWIGDAVMCEPALRAARVCFPKASIAVLARPAVAELLEGHPSVQETLVYEHRGRHAGLAGKWALGRLLRAGRFDAALLFQNAFEAALLACAAGIPHRLGYATDGRALLLTRPVRVPATRSQQVHYYLDLLRAVGYEGAVEAPRLYLREADRVAMDHRLTEAGVGPREALVGLNPGSTYGSAKRWLPDRFAETALRMVRWWHDHEGAAARVVILGAAGEESLGGEIARRIGPGTLVWSGRTSIRELMAVTQRCRLYVTNDTGPMHVAAAFGVPVVAVFGPTDWRTTAPFGTGHAVVRHPVDCAPCLLRECPIDHRCMTGVTVDQVVEAAQQLLTPASQPAAPSPVSSPQHVSLEGVTVFLDRDGTLIHDVGYLNDPEKLEWLPDVLDGLARLKTAGARLIVVTNQSGIARGLITTRQLEAIHARLRADLSARGVELDGLYVCPHHPDDGCACRKPRQGLVEQARRELGLPRGLAYVIGDQARDVELGRRIGARTVLSKTGPLSAEQLAGLAQEGQAPDCEAATFRQAVDWVLADAASRRGAATGLVSPMAT